MRRTTTALLGAALTVFAVTGCSLLGGDDAVPTPTRTPVAAPDARATSTPNPSPTPTPALAVGAVAAETDVVSKSGDTSIHVRIVQRSDGYFDAELSGYRTTNPQPIALQFRHRLAKYTEGNDPSVRGQVEWTGTDAPTSVSLSDAGMHPDYLRSAVLVPMPSADGQGDEDRPWVGSVLAVGALQWSLPNLYPDLAVTVGKARPGAYGYVKEEAGTPRWYQVSHGDELSTVAERFGVTEDQVEWMNPYLELRADRWLHEDATINIDPGSR